MTNAFLDSQSITDQAYHGTSRLTADLILKENFTPGDGDDLFLGPGIYFFEREPSEAIKWAKQKYPTGWVVLKSIVRLGRCLNLHEKEHNDLLIKLVTGIRKRRDEEITEGAAIKLLAQQTQIDTVLGIHRKRSAKPLWHGARFEVGVQMILCVRNLANILHTEEHCTGR